MKKIKKKIDSFTIILVSIVLVFTTIIFLSIPVFYDYKSLQNKIEKKFFSEFKINLKILDDVSYKILPRPHLLIKKANLNIKNNINNYSNVKTENLKIFLTLKNLYNKSNLEFDGLEIQNTNLKLKFNDIINFRDHLYYKINKPIKIKKSKFFFLDKSDKTILISPIYNLNYFIHRNNEFKQLKIKGNLFDINYNSSWKRYYDFPKQSTNEIKIKNPNINIKNFFKFENDSIFSGKSELFFLNENVNINYKVNADKIFIFSPDSNQKIKIFSNIDLNPFYFESEITLNEHKPEIIIDYFLNYITNASPDFLGNLNGNLVINLKNLDNPILKNGKIDFLINEKSINFQESVFEIENVGFINSKLKYYNEENKLMLHSSNVLEIISTKEFAKKFKLKFSKVNKIKKIFFDLKKDIDSGEISISNIQININKPDLKTDKYYDIKNFQMLRAILRKELI